jgi:hypothetical protein
MRRGNQVLSYGELLDSRHHLHRLHSPAIKPETQRTACPVLPRGFVIELLLATMTPPLGSPFTKCRNNTSEFLCPVLSYARVDRCGHRCQRRGLGYPLIEGRSEVEDDRASCVESIQMSEIAGQTHTSSKTRGTVTTTTIAHSIIVASSRVIYRRICSPPTSARTAVWDEDNYDSTISCAK